MRLSITLVQSFAFFAVRLKAEDSRPAGIDQRRSDTVQRMYRRMARTLGVQK